MSRNRIKKGNRAKTYKGAFPVASNVVGICDIKSGKQGKYRIAPTYKVLSSYTNKRILYEWGWNTLWNDESNYDEDGKLKPIHPRYWS